MKDTMLGNHDNPFAFKNHKKGYAPFKILWMKGDTVTKIGYCQTEKEAEDAMADYRNRKKGIALKLYWSQSLGQYVTIPENPNTDIVNCEHCGHLLESDICDDCGYDNSEESF